MKEKGNVSSVTEYDDSNLEIENSQAKMELEQSNKCPLMNLINNSAITVEVFDDLVGLMKENGFDINNTISYSYFDSETDEEISGRVSYLNYLFAKGELEKAKVLIKHGMDVNFIDPLGVHKVLPLSALVGNQDISPENFAALIDLMLEHGLDINQAQYCSYFDEKLNMDTHFQESFLIDLLLDGEIKKAEVLIKHGMDVNFVDPTNPHASSPLLTLVNNRDISSGDFKDIINLMLKYGLNINQTHSISYFDEKLEMQIVYQQSFLIDLFWKGEADKAKTLIKAGSNVNFTNATQHSFSSPLSNLIRTDQISTEDFVDLINLMKEHGLNMQIPYYHYIITSVPTAKAEALVGCGADVNYYASEANRNSYEVMLLSYPNLMDALRKAIIFGHNTVTHPDANDHKTKAAIAIYNYKSGDKKALDGTIGEGKEILNLCLEYISLFEYYPEIPRVMDLGNCNQLSNDVRSVIFSYLPLENLVEWIQQGLSTDLTAEQDVLKLLTHVQDQQNIAHDPDEVTVTGEEDS